MAPDMRRELVRRALASRLLELRADHIEGLRPQEFGAQAAFVRELQAQVLKEGEAWPGPSVTSLAITGGWTEWAGDCLEALRKLSLREELSLSLSDAPAVEPFLSSLRASAGEAALRFRLTVERYSCPLNIALDGEESVRERLLERLMVQDRARIERGGMEAGGFDDALLKLNLVAVCAINLRDLRYLDALNYYYELRPESWKPSEHLRWLLVSWFGLYAQALSLWLDRKL